VSDHRTLIQCIGNPLRCDDGAGPAVALLLRNKPLSNCTITEQWGEGSGLMQAWPPYHRVILIDAAASGAPPGTLHRFDTATDAIPSNFLCYSTHRFGVAEAIALARILGSLPPQLTLYAIEGENFGYGEELTPAVSDAVIKLSEWVQATL